MRWRDYHTGFGLRIFVAIATTATIFLLISLYGHHASTHIMLRTVEKSASAITAQAATAIEKFLGGTETFPKTLAQLLEKGDVTEAQLFTMLRGFVESNPAVYGAAVAFEPFRYDPRRQDFAPYVHRVPEGVREKWLGGTYDYRAREWYRLAKEGGKPFWTEPFISIAGGGVMVCTFVVPFYHHEGGRPVFSGTVNIDISLEWLNKTRSGFPVTNVIIVSRSGKLIVYPIRELVLNKTIFDLEALAGDKGYGEMGRRMLKGEHGFVRLKSYVTGKPSWVYFSPIGLTGWSVALVAPEEELLSGIRDLNNRLVAFGAVTVLLLSAILYVVSYSVTKPLALLSAATRKIAEGNLDDPLPSTRGPREVLALRNCLEEMRRDLGKHMEALAAASVREERIASELRIARSIQASFLPRTFPEGGAFDVHALLDPAREVGGDLYDFFLLDEDHLFFTIGDVADKGVPAALFMAATVTAIRALAQKGLRPAEILARANGELSRGNEEMMFVTLLCGILDLRDGRLVLANAGHLCPVLLVENAPPTIMEVKPGLVLGVREGVSYSEVITIIPTGAVLVLFTDGVTEAGSEKGTLLGMDGVLATLAESADTVPESVVVRLMDRVVRQDGQLADDTAILALRYKGI